MRIRHLIKVISISGANQRVHTQINIPRDVRRIVGVYHSIVMNSTANAGNIPPLSQGLFLRRNVHCGELRLQTFDRSGWGFTSDVYLPERNLPWQNSAQLPFFPVQPFSHGQDHFTPLDFVVDGDTTVVHVYYRNRWVTPLQVNYTVKLYISCELR